MTSASDRREASSPDAPADVGVTRPASTPASASAIPPPRSPASTATSWPTRSRTPGSPPTSSPSTSSRPTRSSKRELEIVVTGLSSRTRRATSAGGAPSVGARSGPTGDSTGSRSVRSSTARASPSAGGSRATEVAEVPSHRCRTVTGAPTRSPSGPRCSRSVRLSAGGVYGWSRRRGRNEVFAGGAADAAFGGPARRHRVRRCRRPARTRRRRHGRALRRRRGPRRPGHDRVRAADGRRARGRAPSPSASASTTAPSGRGSPGSPPATCWRSQGRRRRRHPRRATRPAPTAEDRRPRRRAVLRRRRRPLGTYDKEFAGVWRDVKAMQERTIVASGWWKRLPPTAGGCAASACCHCSCSAASGCSSGPAPVCCGWPASSRRRSPRSPSPPCAGGRRVRRLPLDAPRPQRRRVGGGAAHGVVPPVPRGQRGPSRRVGVEARPDPRVLGVGRRLGAASAWERALAAS